MTRRNPSELIEGDPEIERTALHTIRSRIRQRAAELELDLESTQSVTMEEQQRTMSDYARPSLHGTESSIVRPSVAANNFEIKPNIIHMVQQTVQFDGLQDEDPNQHIADFLEICDTFKINGVTDDAIRLRLFPFSLRSKAKQWLNTLPKGSIVTWEQMAEKFLAKYFPPAKTAKLRNDISSFVQVEAETLYDTWERFKELLRRCPHHGLPTWLQVQTFYGGLNLATKQMIDAAAGGTLNNKTPEAAQELIESMALNAFQWQNPRGKANKVAGVYDVDPIAMLARQMEALTKKIDGLSATQQSAAAMQDDSVAQGIEQVDFMGNAPRPQNNPYSNTYNPGWRNHPNFSWGNQNNQRQSHPPGFQSYPQQEKKSNLEELLTKYIQTSEARFQSIETTLKSHGASIHNLETQIGQIAKALSERPQGSLPSNTETNPREYVKAVTLRNGKELRNEKPMEKEVAVEEEKKDSTVEKPPVREYQPRIPYPARLMPEKKDEQFGKFLELFKQLHINLPLVDALLQMPKYAKFLKELLTNKRKLEEVSQVTLNEECSALLQRKLPQKLKDPGSFSIPCSLGSLSFDRALADLGASINLMPYSLFKRLGLGEPKPIQMSIQLADRSFIHPRGIIEDVLVKVDKFIFPVDFVIMDMDEDLDLPFIFGRPFLATARALIDVSEGRLVLRVGDEEVIFRIPESITGSPAQGNACFCINTSTDNIHLSQEIRKRISAMTPVNRKKEEPDDPRRVEKVAHAKGNRPKVRKKEQVVGIPEGVRRVKPFPKEPP